MTDMKIYHFWPYQREEKGDVWRIFIPSSLSIFGQEKIHFYLAVLFKLSKFYGRFCGWGTLRAYIFAGFWLAEKGREESIVIRPLEKASKAITGNDVMTQLCRFLTELIERRRILNYVRTGRSQAASNYSSLDYPTNK